MTPGWAEDGLARLRKVWEGLEERSYRREDVEGIEVYLVLRACLGLKETGEFRGPTRREALKRTAETHRSWLLTSLRPFTHSNNYPSPSTTTPRTSSPPSIFTPSKPITAFTSDGRTVVAGC